jgi:hypothetical protein
MKAPADTPPPEKEAPTPDQRNEQFESATLALGVQSPESALMTLCKSWMRATTTDRRLFLEDVKAGAPNLWREVSGNSR